MKKLKEVLKEKSISATSLSDLMKKKGYSLSRISIGNIISGQSSPKVSTLQEIADTLDINICTLFDGPQSQEMDIDEAYFLLNNKLDQIMSELSSLRSDVNYLSRYTEK